MIELLFLLGTLFPHQQILILGTKKEDLKLGIRIESHSWRRSQNVSCLQLKPAKKIILCMNFWKFWMLDALRISFFLPLRKSNHRYNDWEKVLRVSEALVYNGYSSTRRWQFRFRTKLKEDDSFSLLVHNF